MKPQRIEGTRDYFYKGFIIGRYETGRGGIRWNVEKGGKEIKHDLTRLYSAVSYINGHEVPPLAEYCAVLEYCIGSPPKSVVDVQRNITGCTVEQAEQAIKEARLF